MKRALKKRVKAVIENTPGDNAPVEQHVSNTRINLRVPAKAAMIGLAISMGATSLLVTRQTDQALGSETVGSQNDSASMIPANSDTDVKFTSVNSLEAQAVSTVSVPENPAIVQPTAISQVSGLGTKQIATQQAVVVPVRQANQNSTSQQFPQTPGASIASANANQQEFDNPIAFTSTNNQLNAQLKAQQDFAINSLQQKSSRLRASLSQLHSGVNQQTPTLVSSTAVDLSKSNQNLAVVPTSTPNTLTPSASSVYQVKTADTLPIVVTHYGTSVSELNQANNLNNPNQLQINEKLTVPTISNRNTGKQATVAKVAPTNQIQAYTQSTATKATNLTANTPVQLASTPTTEAKVNPRLRSLQQEIARLQEKYRAQESGHPMAPEITQISTTAAAPSPVRVNNVPASIPVPPPIASNNTPKPTQFEFSASRPTDDPVDPFFVYHQTAQKQTPVVEQKTARVIAPAMGSDVPEFSNVQRGATVSPDLPPLASVDIYLPKDESTPANSGAKVAFAWPTKGVITSPFGMRWGRMHKGIDIANSTGTPVYAAADGVVAVAGWTNGGYGNLVEIHHPNGSITRYAHNSKVLVHPGQQVHQGEIISLMGTTGFSTGPHSHFEIHPPGKGAMNPIAFLPPRI